METSTAKTTSSVTKLTFSEREELIKLIQQLEYNQKYNKLAGFTAYPFQVQFYNAGANVKRRFLCAANRVGKSYSEAYEMSMHLTGRYPSWWEGHKFDKPILAWAVGITGDSTRKVLQKELLGTPMGKDIEALGTGAIPRDCIDFETLERDGNIIKIVKVKHVTGDFSTLEFRSTQQGEHTLMGATVDYIWADEEDPYRSTELYSQMVTRTATTSGHVVITATPENGITKLVDMFMSNTDGNLYYQNATWDDAPHLDEETKKELLSSIPEWQWDMRTKGIPLNLKGLVFTHDPSAFTVENVQIDEHDEILWALDITHVGQQGNDPTVLSLVVKKAGQGQLINPDRPEEGNYDLHILYLQKTFATEGFGKQVAQWIRDNSSYTKAPIILPHDASEGFGNDLREYGMNVMVEKFYNPDLSLASVGTQKNGKNRDVDVGLNLLNLGFDKEFMKVQASQCPEFMREITVYSRTGKKGDAAFKGNDDHIDSGRYSLASSWGYRGFPVRDCYGLRIDDDWNNRMDLHENNVASELSQYY
ncbi:hypothetical protein CWO07_24185 [Vibrio splendidus]|uniref:Uncharacterized protein n=1 Tax=Vibrio splendidus TaxID=29497 RepID=A0A2T5EJ92_VIBSP|nr:terminase family protein [Vibrio splendidus]PTP20213.1 hypothetical protein CWO07_24185 [Vibrio splendidus]